MSFNLIQDVILTLLSAETVAMTAQKMKLSIKDFFCKCDQSAGTCGFGHI